MTEEARGLGVGKALFKYLGNLCKQKDLARMDWVVLDWNEPAKEVYRRMGAVQVSACSLCQRSIFNSEQAERQILTSSAGGFTEERVGGHATGGRRVGEAGRVDTLMIMRRHLDPLPGEEERPNTTSASLS